MSSWARGSLYFDSCQRKFRLCLIAVFQSKLSHLVSLMLYFVLAVAVAVATGEDRAFG